MSCNVIIRKAIESDADQMIKHTKVVLTENPDVMGTTIEEFNTTSEEEKDWINAHHKQGILLVAEVDGEIIGMLNFRLSPRKKFCHQGIFGMSIQEKFSNKGIGSSLIEKLLEWAKDDPRVEKISLEVFSNNVRAIHLYKKFGFREEGRRLKQAKLGSNEYVDDILLSKFI